MTESFYQVSSHDLFPPSPPTAACCARPTVLTRLFTGGDGCGVRAVRVVCEGTEAVMEEEEGVVRPDVVSNPSGCGVL